MLGNGMRAPPESQPLERARAALIWQLLWLNHLNQTWRGVLNDVYGNGRLVGVGEDLSVLHQLSRLGLQREGRRGIYSMGR